RVLRQRRRCDGHAQHERAQNDREFPHAMSPGWLPGPSWSRSRFYIRIPARRGACIARPAALPSSATGRLHMASANTIVKQVVLKAPLERVWQAIADSERFGHWFGAEVDGAFTPGARLQAKIRPTRVDPEIAKFQEPYDGVAFVLLVERVEPMRLLSFRWHPGGTDVGPDAPDDETTLVEFALEETDGGTRLTITESGFERE